MKAKDLNKRLRELRGWNQYVKNNDFLNIPPNMDVKAREQKIIITRSFN